MSEGRLRLTILGGFLGSGKTTWLRHQLHTRAFGRVHVIVNEAADAPVDDALLARADQMTLLAGACACCAGQGGLIAALLDICNRRSGEGDPTTRLEHIVLETSGLADPDAILSLIQGHPILARQIVVAEIVVIVDTLNGGDQVQQEPLSRKQIEAADRLILTKTDAAQPDQVARLRATLASLAPAAQQSGALFGSGASLPDYDVTTTKPYSIAERPDTPIHASQIELGATADWTAFTVWLSALLFARGDQIVRVKGVVRTPAGRLLVQTVRKSVQSPEILPESRTEVATDNSIAVIGRGFTQQQLSASLAQFSA
ncbi:MAG: GTP-binding protein [Tateyamaria sp.]|uniref:CobW family GTP-binding protein n=1 Tax=Tateyamaria sp. TaxID=1929288 RepID=UPI003288D60E